MAYLSGTQWMIEYDPTMSDQLFCRHTCSKPSYVVDRLIDPTNVHPSLIEHIDLPSSYMEVFQLWKANCHKKRLSNVQFHPSISRFVVDEQCLQTLLQINDIVYSASNISSNGHIDAKRRLEECRQFSAFETFYFADNLTRANTEQKEEIQSSHGKESVNKSDRSVKTSFHQIKQVPYTSLLRGQQKGSNATEQSLIQDWIITPLFENRGCNSFGSSSSIRLLSKNEILGGVSYICHNVRSGQDHVLIDLSLYGLGIMVGKINSTNDPIKNSQSLIFTLQHVFETPFEYIKFYNMIPKLVKNIR